MATPTTVCVRPASAIKIVGCARTSAALTVSAATQGCVLMITRLITSTASAMMVSHQVLLILIDGYC